MLRKISAGSLALFLRLLLTSCGNQEKEVSAAESQLYGTTESLFSDSYSMELWSLEQVSNPCPTWTGASPRTWAISGAESTAF